MTILKTQKISWWQVKCSLNLHWFNKGTKEITQSGRKSRTCIEMKDGGREGQQGREGGWEGQPGRQGGWEDIEKEPERAREKCAQAPTYSIRFKKI